MRIVKLLLVFGFLFLVDSAMAQFRHFPHGQRMVFSWWSNLDTDKGYYDSIATKMDGDSLPYTEIIPYTSSHHFCLDSLSARYGAFSWIRFYTDSLGLMIKLNSNDTLIRIPHSMQVGDTFRWNNHEGVILDRFDWYHEGNFKDSAWYFYRFSGDFYLEDSMILGKNRGWIKGGRDMDLNQIAYYDGDSLRGRNILDWKIFFPEEAGDWKRFFYAYESWNSTYYGKEILDSFMVVTKYTDSIRIRKKQWVSNINGIWTTPRIIDTLIHPEVFINYFNDAHFGDRTMVIRHSEPIMKAIIHTNVGEESDHTNTLLFTILNPDYRFFGTDTCDFMDQGKDGISFYKETVGMDWEFYQQEGFTLKLIGGHVGDTVFGYSFLSLPFESGEAVKIYPNPVKSQLFISTLDPQFEYEVYAMNGMNIPLAIRNNTLDVQSLQPGAYLVLIKQNGKYYRKLFLKE